MGGGETLAQLRRGVSSLTIVWGVMFFLIGLAGTWLARRYALARQLLDQPDARRSHAVATPRGGGIAIVAAMLAGAVVAWGARGAEGGQLGAFVAGLGMVAGIGWVDDHRPLSSTLRFVVHVLASGLFALATWLASGQVGLTVLAFGAPLVLTNIWNFMDGIDGLAASQAAIVAGVLAFQLDAPWQLPAMSLAAASLGFLPFNLPKARIFMGDVGSGAIGFALGALCVVAARQQGPASAWLLLPLAPFLMDAGLTLGRRVLRGEQWWTPHVQHAYQMCARRHGHPPVTAAYALAAFAGGALALLLKENEMVFIVFCVSAWYMSAAVFWVWLQQRFQGAIGSSAGPFHKESK